jgi:hypothetical protein
MTMLPSCQHPTECQYFAQSLFGLNLACHSLNLSSSYLCLFVRARST